MKNTYNLYCDESCHLEHDKQSKIMGLGSVWCLKEKLKDINNRIIEIKNRHNIQKNTELKWTKLSNSKIDCYIDLINYFFDCSDLNFRGLLLNKDKLNHKKFNNSHDDFYYIMYFYLLRNILNKYNQYNVYLDIKDSKSANKIKKVKEYLENFNYDFSHDDMFNNFQSIRSDEVQIMQLTDILLGALVYYNRNLKTSNAKLAIINIIKQRTKNFELKQTWPCEMKFNIFYFTPGDLT